MKIGVLQVDSVLDELQEEFGNYPDMFENMLEKAATDLSLNLEIAHFDVEHEIYLARIDDWPSGSSLPSRVRSTLPFGCWRRLEECFCLWAFGFSRRAQRSVDSFTTPWVRL